MGSSTGRRATTSYRRVTRHRALGECPSAVLLIIGLYFWFTCAKKGVERSLIALVWLGRGVSRCSIGKGVLFYVRSLCMVRGLGRDCYMRIPCDVVTMEDRARLRDLHMTKDFTKLDMEKRHGYDMFSSPSPSGVPVLAI